MKRSVCILVLIVANCWFAVADNRFAVSLNTGTMTPNSTSKRLGIGVLGSFSYSPWEDVAFSLSTGYLTWGYKTTEKYNTRIVPVILGTRYYFARGSFEPYISGELAYINGEYDWAGINYPPPGSAGPFDPASGQPVTGTTSISEVAPGLGLGFQLPLAERLRFDVGSVMLLTAQNAAALNIRLMVGINLSL